MEDKYLMKNARSPSFHHMDRSAVSLYIQTWSINPRKMRCFWTPRLLKKYLEDSVVMSIKHLAHSLTLTKEGRLCLKYTGLVHVNSK